jgi:hypothetical protein
MEDTGGLLALETRAFPQVLQAPAEDDLADRRRGPRLAHAPPTSSKEFRTARRRQSKTYSKVRTGQSWPIDTG